MSAGKQYNNNNNNNNNVCIYNAPYVMQMWIASWEASFARIVGADLVVKPFMIGQFINDTGLLFESYPVEDWEGPRN